MSDNELNKALLNVYEQMSNGDQQFSKSLEISNEDFFKLLSDDSKTNEVKLYIVQMYRWGDTEIHNYTAGVYNNEKEAYRQAAEEYVFRGSMKYLPAIHTCFLNQGKQNFVFGQVLNHEALQKKLDEYEIKPYNHKFQEDDMVITKDGVKAKVLDTCYYSDIYYLGTWENTITVREKDIEI